jgi:hypothetical protein
MELEGIIKCASIILGLVLKGIFNRKILKEEVIPIINNL